MPQAIALSAELSGLGLSEHLLAVLIQQPAIRVVHRGDAVFRVAVVLGDQGEQDFFRVALGFFDALGSLELHKTRAAGAEHSGDAALA